MDLTGFMFGNINEDGELENDELIDKVRILLALVPVNKVLHLVLEFVCLPFAVGNRTRADGNRGW